MDRWMDGWMDGWRCGGWEVGRFAMHLNPSSPFIHSFIRSFEVSETWRAVHTRSSSLAVGGERWGGAGRGGCIREEWMKGMWDIAHN
jgi:hypothetical protein